MQYVLVLNEDSFLLHYFEICFMSNWHLDKVSSLQLGARMDEQNNKSLLSWVICQYARMMRQENLTQWR